MSLTSELIRQGEKDKVWSRYCGHLDLSLKEFMQIQERLLLEQFEIWKDSEIGRHFIGKEDAKIHAGISGKGAAYQVRRLRRFPA